eukprot:1663031-Rhodomonas_salina.1
MFTSGMGVLTPLASVPDLSHRPLADAELQGKLAGQVGAWNEGLIVRRTRRAGSIDLPYFAWLQPVANGVFSCHER